jgi:ribosomal protein L24E
MKVLLVVVSDDNVLVFLEAKLVQRVQGRIDPLGARWTFSRRPCQFIVENRVVATWV